MKKLLLYFLINSIGITLFSQSNEDVLLITEARIALKSYDYKTALSSLGKVSVSGQGTDLYYLYMAQANEGVGDLKSSLFYYEAYSKTTTLTPELAEKIATLRYKIRKKDVATEDKKKQRFDDLSGTYIIQYSSDIEGNIKKKIKLTQDESEIKMYDYENPETVLFEGRRYSYDKSKINGTWHYTYKSNGDCDGASLDVSLSVAVENEGELIKLSFPYVGCKMARGEVTLGLLSALAGEKRETKYEVYADMSLKRDKYFKRN